MTPKDKTKKKSHKIGRGSQLLCCTALLSCFMSISAAAQTTVHILDVGQGLSVLVESQGHTMLYDGGDSDRSSYTVSYLQQHAVSSLDYVVASHYDADHLNRIVGALNVFPAQTVWGPDYTTETRIYQSFQSVLAAKALTCTQPAVGSQYQLGDAQIQILAPSGSDYDKPNDHSIALRIQDGNTSFLLTGDAEQESEAEMLSSGLPLASTVYVAGHHGSSTSSSREFVEAVRPEYAVISCGAGNPYGNPHKETLETLQAVDASIFRTDELGAIVVSTDGTAITWTWEKEPPVLSEAHDTAAASSDVSLSTVYWTPKGKSYHSTRNCATLKRSKTILEGSLSDALAANKKDPCDVCVK